MADSVFKLVVDSKEYDSKIQRATNGLVQFEKKCREVGGTLEFVEKEDIDFVKALGQMETVSSSATGKLGELKKAFTELSVQYKNLTDAEKQSPYGQALAGSIDQIKGRIGELGGQLSDVGKEMNGSKGLVDSFTDALGSLGPAGQTAAKLLKGAFGPVGIAIAAVVGIIQQLVSAFKRNEDAMASASRAAAPFKAIWQQIQQLFDRLVPYIAKGMETIANGMQSLFSKITDWMGKLANTSLGKKLGLDTVYEQLKKVSSAQAELTESNKKIADSENALNKMRRSTDTGNTQRRAQISELRFKASDKTNYSAEERVGFLEKAQELEGKTLQANLALRQKEYELIKLKNSLTKSGTEDLNAENDALNAITDARTEYNEHIRSTQRQLEAARKEMEKEAAVAPMEPAQLSGPTGPSMSRFEELQQSIRIKLADDASAIDTTSLNNLLSVAIQNGIDSLNPNFEELMYKMGEGFDIPDEAWENLTDEINEKLAELGIKPIEIDVKTGGVKKLDKEVKDTTDHVAGAAAAFSALGNAMGQIDDPGAKVAGMIAEAIGSVAAGYGAATAQAASMGPWAWIAFAVTGLATMIATIAGIKSATKGYASGGMVEGTSYSGDNIVARLNAGEGVLTAQGVQNAAAMADGMAGSQRVMVEGRISGKDILLSANNTNRAAGGSRGYYTKVK